jgi:hypothetical protein
MERLFQPVFRCNDASAQREGHTVRLYRATPDIDSSIDAGTYSVRESPWTASTKNTPAKTTTMVSSIQIGKE